MVGHFLTPVLTTQVFRPVVDTGGTPRSAPIITPSGDQWSAGGTAKTQIGSGSTPATDQDIGVETPFGNAPESSPVNSQAPSYILDTGNVNQATQIQPLGGSVSIEEVTKIRPVRVTGGGTHDITISRIIVSPPVVGTVGQTVNLNYEVSI